MPGGGDGGGRRRRRAAGENRYWFSSLADITLKVSVKTDGRQVASYEFKLPHLQPGESEDMHLPVLALGQGKR